MITPLSGPDALDLPGLEKLVEHILSGGVHGLFILGTTGEGPALSYRLRHELVERVCKQIHSRVPVLVGVTDTSFTESIRLAEHAARQGADAIVAAPPYYFDANQAELFRYFQQLATSAPLPVYLYNAPAYTGHSLAVETVRDLARIPGILGLKDSSGSMVYFHLLQDALRDRPDFTLLVGPEELMAEAVLLGGNGGICGGANYFPHLHVQLFNAAAAGNLPEVNRLQRRVMRASASFYHVTSHPSAYLAGMKCVLSLLGICNDILTEPFRSFGTEERDEVRRRLAAFADDVSL